MKRNKFLKSSRPKGRFCQCGVLLTGVSLQCRDCYIKEATEKLSELIKNEGTVLNWGNLNVSPGPNETLSISMDYQPTIPAERIVINFDTDEKN